MKIAISILALAVSGCAYRNCVRPGQADSIEIPIENHEASLLPLKGVRVDSSGPSYFIVDNNEKIDVFPGETKRAILNFHIEKTGYRGAFNVATRVRMDSSEADPNPKVNDSTVKFILKDQCK
jgi:uncharacterized membrane protein